jgi:hypothetical protein
MERNRPSFQGNFKGTAFEGGLGGKKNIYKKGKKTLSLIEPYPLTAAGF